MSHQIFFQYHLDGGPQAVPTKSVLAAFEPFLRDYETDSVEIRFSEQETCRLFIKTDVESVSHFMVSRPCADPRLYDSLFNAALLGNAVSYFPPVERAIVFRPDTVKHLPEDLLSSMGEPLCLVSVPLYRNHSRGGFR